MYRSASITIAGSNNPHGVVQFGQNSLNVRVNEDSGKENIQIDRKFGAIGNTVYHKYFAVLGFFSSPELKALR